MAKKYSDELEQLIASLKKDEYVPKTSEEIEQEATRKVSSYYDQQELSARQAFETSDQALSQQLQSIGKSYDKQREASRLEYANAYSEADREMLSRGMQRSSFNAQTLSNISTLAAKAQQEIYDNETNTQADIEAQRLTLARQLGDQLRQYTASESNDILSAIDDLENTEYTRAASANQTNNSLAAMIYEYMRAEESSSGGGGGGGSSGGTPATPTGGSGMTYEDWMALLKAGGKIPSGYTAGASVLLAAGALKGSLNQNNNSPAKAISIGLRKKLEEEIAENPPPSGLPNALTPSGLSMFNTVPELPTPKRGGLKR